MKLLLHACCGPCSLEPVRLLKAEGYDLRIAYINPNIHPEEEYTHRLQTLLDWATDEGIPVIEGEYDPDVWERTVGCHGTDRPARCRACYRLRLERAAQMAVRERCEAISTTLAVSPYQFTDIIEQELARAASSADLTPVFRDWRENYPEATRRSRELGMYRQNYCGCHFSDLEAQAEREARRAARKAAKEEKRRAREAAFAAVSSTDERREQLRTSDFDYDLPPELIAQAPADPRDSCRLMVLDRKTGAVSHEVFTDIIEHLRSGDLLVANETRVMPARLLGRKADTGGAAETLLLHAMTGEGDEGPSEDAGRTTGTWECLVKPGRRLKPGTVIEYRPRGDGEDVPPVLLGTVVAITGQAGERAVRFEALDGTLWDAFHVCGNVPLPPYITSYVGDPEMYQTVYSRSETSAAAPTAGLHFTPELIERINARGIRWETVELEVGLDTFRIVTEENPLDHKMHTERYSVPEKVVEAIAETKASGGRVIAVGTTSVRSLESAWDDSEGRLVSRDGAQTSLFIYPGYTFHVVDALITNFHVPRSTLMMLVSALAGREHIMAAYQSAVRERYRMLSFGDAMFIE